MVGVIRRGPSGWFQLGKWDLEKPAYEPGAWFKGSLYPQRCDLSPDGRWFCYLALQESADGNAGHIPRRISRRSAFWPMCNGRIGILKGNCLWPPSRENFRFGSCKIWTTKKSRLKSIRLSANPTRNRRPIGHATGKRAAIDLEGKGIEHG